MTPLDFWGYVSVDRAVECWRWTGAVAYNGEGVRTFEGKKMRAARVAWVLTNGDPGPLCVMRSCDNARCVLPAHLYLGSMRDVALKWRQASRELTTVDLAVTTGSTAAGEGWLLPSKVDPVTS